MLRSAVANLFRPRRAAAPKTLVGEFLGTFLPFRSVATERGTTDEKLKRGGSSTN